MKAPPFLIQESTTGNKLHPLGENERLYREDWLQKTLRQYPDILPTAEVEPVFHPLVPIGREVNVGTGSIDNLFISHRGYLVLVETKLWRNPQAKREVVAQAIDYGSSISKWNYSKLDEVVQDYTKRFEDQKYDLVNWVVRQRGPVEGGQEFFEETVANNLRLGRFLILIVGDKIRPSIIEMLGYINKYPHLATDLALVQLNCYRWQPESNWPLLIVPSIVARTEIIERSVIQVTIKQDGTYQTDVRQEGGKQGREELSRITLTEEAYWELLKKQAPEGYELARKLVDSYREKESISIEPKEASIVAALDIQGTGQQASLFFLDKNANLRIWPGTIGSQLIKAGVSRDLTGPYDAELRRILDMPASRVEFSRPITKVNLHKFTAVVDDFIKSVQAAERGE